MKTILRRQITGISMVTLATLLSFWALLALAPDARAFTCDKDCDDQCEVGGFGFVEPNCYAACSVWRVSCFDLSNPLVSLAGEIGAQAYADAASTMQARAPTGVPITGFEQQVLSYFFRDVIGNVRVHYDAQLMDSWGRDPVKIDLYMAICQTYGFDIYCRFPANSRGKIFLATVLGHELMHVRQFVQMGQSFQRFGREYFESYVNAGFNYDNIGFEREAFNKEDEIRRHALEEDHRLNLDLPWNLEICNNTENDPIWAAVGYDSSLPMSLVGNFTAKGWFSIQRGTCMNVHHNAVGTRPVFAFATTNTRGGSWRWPAVGDEPLCVNQSDRFSAEIVAAPGLTIDTCRGVAGGDNAAIAMFELITNPRENGPSDKATWNVVGGGSVTPPPPPPPPPAGPAQATVHICNTSQHPTAYVSMLYEWLEGGSSKWRTQGWWAIARGQCTDLTFNNNSPIYMFASPNALPETTTRWTPSGQQYEGCSHPRSAFLYEERPATPNIECVALVSMPEDAGPHSYVRYGLIVEAARGGTVNVNLP